MTEPDQYSYPRYLEAKKTVDDRSLNERVFGSFIDRMVAGNDSPIRILEVGGGVGATLERIVDALDDRSVEAVDYTLVDVEPANVDAARESLPEWGREQGLDVWGSEDRIVFSGGDVDVSIQLVEADLFDVAAEITSDDEPFDALVAQAVFDILDLHGAIEALRPLLRDGGLWYLPIHFDGVTAFEPVVDPGMDAWIERLYHESMTESRAPGDLQEDAEPSDGRGGPHTGRRLLTALREAGATLLDAGSSDWIVFAGENGYRGDEAYFLHHILHFVESELTDHPDVDDDAFTSWMDERRRQIDEEELIYVAHQIDVLART